MKKKIGLVFVVFFLLTSIVFAATPSDFYNYGNNIYSKGDYKKAITYYIYAAKLEPKNPTYYSAIAACYSKMGNQAMANKFSRYAQTLPENGSNGASIETGSDKMKITAFAGFTTASMTKVNAWMNSIYNSFAAGVTASKQNIGNGFIIGTQGGFGLMKGLYVGPRLEYVGILTAKTTASMTILGITYRSSFENSASIINIMGGASYYIPLQGVPLTLSGDLYMGYGLAGYNLKIVSTGSSDINIPLSGGAFAAVIAANADYKLTNSFTAGLSLGYRIANVSQMKMTKDYGSLKKGDVFTDPLSTSGSALPFDFSGLIISLNGNYSF